MPELLNVDTLIEDILRVVQPVPAETVPLSQALGRVLAEDVISDLDLPPFANSSMDGYAVRSADLAETPHTLKVVFDIPAGVFPSQVIGAGEAARIMTGAPLPEGADAVVPVEDTDTLWQPGDALTAQVTIQRSVKPGDNVRPVGENVRRGQMVLVAGTYLQPQHIGIIASLGRAAVLVVRRPRVAILTTGDELAPPETPLQPGQIYDANTPMLSALVEQYGGEAIALPPAADTLEAVRALFREALAQQPDVIVSSAGVSVGAADYVREVLNELGRVDFWRINLRPGKPLAFGLLSGVPFFGLPGNPVSAFVTFDVVVRPALLRMQGREADLATVIALTAEDIRSDGRRSYLRVTLSRQDGQYIAALTGTQSSGALFSLVEADGLLIVSEDTTFVPAGTMLPVRLLRPV